MDPKWQTVISNHISVRFPGERGAGYGVYLRAETPLEIVVAIAWGMGQGDDFCKPSERFEIVNLDLASEEVTLKFK